MKRHFYTIILAGAALCFGLVSTAFLSNSKMETPKETTAKSLYDFTLKSLDGKDISLSQYKGKKMLIVNTASQCGYTPQYKQLQELHTKYGSKVVVLGFPCNDFGAQEPGNAGEIKTFCEKNYGVTFQLFSKIHVKGTEKAPLYKWLSDKKENGVNDKEPSWNFCKYLIDENGQLLHFYESSISPTGSEITDLLK